MPYEMLTSLTLRTRMMVPGLNDLVYVAGSYRMDLSSGLGLAGSYSSLSVRWSQRHEWTLPMMRLGFGACWCSGMPSSEGMLPTVDVGRWHMMGAVFSCSWRLEAALPEWIRARAEWRRELQPRWTYKHLRCSRRRVCRILVLRSSCSS